MSLMLVPISVLIIHTSASYHLIQNKLPQSDTERFCNNYCSSNSVTIHDADQHSKVTQMIEHSLNMSIISSIWSDVYVFTDLEAIWTWTDVTSFDYGSGICKTSWTSLSHIRMESWT